MNVIQPVKISIWICLSIPPFFGLGPKYRPLLHEQIFDLVYWGKGGFGWHDVYNMPVWLRTFYIKKIEKILKDQNKAQEEANKKAKAAARRRR